MTVLFNYAFRPLFLLATLHGLVVVPLWVAAWLGYLSLPLSLGSPIWWHGHEMLYGFAGAAIGGFALTAVATWTNRPPVAGTPLVILSLLWLSARLLLFVPTGSLVTLGMVADVGYGVLLCGLMAREVFAARSQRNYTVIVILALLPVTNAMFFVGAAQNAAWATTALVAGLWLIVLLINLIAGRIIPAFTRNWLKQKGTPQRLPPFFNRTDLVATVALIIFATLHIADEAPNATAAVGLFTAILLLVRSIRWQGYRTVADPIVWVLHVAFLWIPVGVVLLSAAELGWVPRNAGVHALTSGAITTMILAVASRAALGHTNRLLRATPAVTSAYALITLSALLRVSAAVGFEPNRLLLASAAAWFLGFLCFAWHYLPVLIQPAPQRSLPIV